GCGRANAMTGISEAAKSRTPMIVLAGEVAAAAVRSNFRIDQAGMAEADGAVAERVHSAQTAVADTLRAYRTAVYERRTVVLNLPLDVQHQPVDDAAVRKPPPPQPIRPDQDTVRELAARIGRAAR